MSLSRTVSLLVNKPYYVFRPMQIVRRVGSLRGRDVEEAVLPWGLPIRFDRRDVVGSAVVRTGLYDATVCEALYRLVDPGELAIDLGANIGVMTSVLAHRVGPSGEVVAAEPHPATADRLEANVERWRDASTITVVRKAISDRRGTVVLRNPGPDAGYRDGRNLRPADRGRTDRHARRAAQRSRGRRAQARRRRTRGGGAARCDAGTCRRADPRRRLRGTRFAADSGESPSRGRRIHGVRAAGPFAGRRARTSRPCTIQAMGAAKLPRNPRSCASALAGRLVRVAQPTWLTRGSIS